MVTMKTSIDISNRWNADTEYDLGFCRIIGRFLGIWPLDQPNISTYMRVAFVILIHLSMSLGFIALLIIQGNCGTIVDITDVLTLVACGFLTVLKMLTLTVYQDNMYIIVNTAVEDWSEVNNKKSHDIMLKYGYMGRVMFITLMTAVYSAAGCLIIFKLPFIVNLLNHYTDSNLTVYRLPVGPSCWVTSDMSSNFYITFFTVQCIQVAATATAYVGSDTYFFSIAMHVCGQFELLYSKFECLNKGHTDEKQKQFLSNIVERHNHLLLLTNTFEHVYNGITLGLVLSDTVIICTTSIAILTSLQSGDTIVYTQLIIRIYVAYIQLFIYCYVGEQLNMQAQKLGMAIYNSDWYNMPYEIIKDYKFVIMRANYPFYLTAGKMYNMNHENFKNILKGMASFFSILRLMLIDDIQS